MSKAKSFNANVLVTRPEPKGRALVTALQAENIPALSFPLFAYQMAENPSECEHLLTANSSIIIFVSVPSVEYAAKILPVADWQYDHVIAVGEATKQQLKTLGINAISPERQNSEGVLSLPILQQVSNKHIHIFRGDAGRELLFTELTKRGAQVSYGQCYQRVWQNLDSQSLEQWREDGGNCIVITSVALLENMLNLLVSSEKYWQKSCYWLVASERIASKASQLGLAHVVNTHGADNASLLHAILKLE